MAFEPAPSLYRYCRSWDLRMDTFINRGMRYLTGLEYAPIDEILYGDNRSTDGHYVFGKLGGDRDYSHEESS